MKKYVFIMVVGFLMGALVSGVSASEMDKGSLMEDTGSVMEKKGSVASKEEPKEIKASLDVVVTEVAGIKKSDSSDWGVANSAKAMIKGTAEDSTISGTVDFVQTGDGVQVVASLSNVTPSGNHGIHIHANGSCDEGGKAAGGHFNPDGTDHGLLPRDGYGKAHVGDMGNIKIDADGNGSLVVFLPKLSLTEGRKNVDGKAIILHAKEDDFGQPTGNAGGRIGCGIITMNN